MACWLTVTDTYRVLLTFTDRHFQLLTVTAISAGSSSHGLLADSAGSLLGPGQEEQAGGKPQLTESFAEFKATFAPLEESLPKFWEEALKANLGILQC